MPSKLRLARCRGGRSAINARVLILHNEYRNRGGEENYIELVTKALSSRGLIVDHLVWSSVALTSSWAARAETAALMTFNPKAGRRVAQRLFERPADIVHAHNLLPMATPSALRAAASFGSGVVLTAHNHRLFCPSGTLMRNGSRHEDCVEGSSLLCALRGSRDSRLESLAYGVAVAVQRRLRLSERWTDAIVAPSAYLRNTLVRAGVDSALIRHIPNGVPVQPYSPRPRHYVLFAGRLSVEKGLRTLLRAAELTTDIPFVVAGDGPLGEAGRALAPSNVKWVGLVSQERLAALRLHAAVEVIPSECPDILPFSGLEALAAGVPVVGANVGGIPEIAKAGAGETVPPGDVEALAGALSRWWNLSQTESRHGEAAAALAAKEYSIDKHVDRLLALYSEISVKRRRQAGPLAEAFQAGASSGRSVEHQ